MYIYIDSIHLGLIKGFLYRSFKAYMGTCSLRVWGYIAIRIFRNAK